MDYVLNQETFEKQVDFKIDDTFVVTDDLELKIVVRDSLGEKKYVKEDMLTVEADSYSLLIPAEINVKDSEVLFNEYIAEITYKHNGTNRVTKVPYRVVDYVPFSADINSIRQYYGLNESEVTEDAIDLQEVVLNLSIEMGEVFLTSLRSSDQSRFRANRLITLTACEQLWPSLQLRSVYSEGDSTAKYSRHSKIDWNRMLQKIIEEIGELKDNLPGVTGFTEVDYNPIALGAVTDPITGV